MLSKKIEIVNKLGLHARASSKLVELANKFSATITIQREVRMANAKSIMTVMMLAANKGTEITITTDGADEELAMTAITDLINNKFGELE